MSEPRVGRSERLYRLLLGIFPPRFRELYGSDAAELFLDRFNEACVVGAWSVAWLWVKTIPNMVVHARSSG